MLPAESHWIHTLKPSQFINEELRVGSFACFADPLLRCQDPAELCAFLCLEEWLRMLENTGDCKLGQNIGDEVVPFCACAKSVRSP